MNEKSDSSITKEDSSVKSSCGVASVGPPDQTLDKVLERLPSQFRKEIVKQYKLPTSDISIFTIFRYGTLSEYALQILGILMAILAGIERS